MMGGTESGAGRAESGAGRAETGILLAKLKCQSVAEKCRKMQ